MFFHLSISAWSSALRASSSATWSNFLCRDSRAARVLRARFRAILSLGSTAIGGRAPLRRRDLLMPFVAGELVTDDFLRNKLESKTIGDPVLEEPERSIDWLLIVRSMGSCTAGAYLATS